ncbi:MAG: glycoside hydrolase family 104 protein [Boseongicola sp. SB0677_bin_26]|nr:glycoside hydrolase family 104 protein [Boseongicola sp. SB0665_bin_10]MYG28009.1 glycoside hydrolase family 104 protein [Boseongicola sp. SB0677_bin_26]
MIPFRTIGPGLRLAAVTALALVSGAGFAGERTVTDVLALVRALEAPGGYDAYEGRIPIPPPRPLTAMTVGEVLDWQAEVRSAGAPSTAAGGYQVIRATLERLVRAHRIDRDAPFDAAMQDRLARLLVAECGDPGPGSRHPRFADCLAGIWAALPLATGPGKGRSAYAGIAGNRALTDPGTVLAVLSGRPVTLPDGVSRDAPPAVSDDEVLAFGAVRIGRINAAMRDAAHAGTLTPSIRDWRFDPYAVD